LSEATGSALAADAGADVIERFRRLWFDRVREILAAADQVVRVTAVA